MATRRNRVAAIPRARRASLKRQRLALVSMIDKAVMAADVWTAMRGENALSDRHAVEARRRGGLYRSEVGNEIADSVPATTAAELLVHLTKDLVEIPIEIARQITDAWARGKRPRRSAQDDDVWIVITASLAAGGFGVVKPGTMKRDWEAEKRAQKPLSPKPRKPAARATR